MSIFSTSPDIDDTLLSVLEESQRRLKQLGVHRTLDQIYNITSLKISEDSKKINYRIMMGIGYTDAGDACVSFKSL